MKRIIKYSFIFLVLAYLAGAVVFTMYTFPNTKVDGQQVGMVKKETIYVRERYRDTFKANLVNGQETEVEVELEKKLDDNSTYTDSLTWIQHIFSENNYETTTELVRSSVQPQIQKLNAIKPVSSEIKLNETEAEITEPVFGYNIDPEEFVYNVESKTIDFDDFKVDPEVLPEDLAAREAKLDELLSSSVSLLGYELSGRDYLNLYDEDFNLIAEKVEDFVRMVAGETDTLKKTREFKTATGQTKTVAPGIYGWSLNIEKTTNRILETKTGQIEPAYTTYARRDDRSNDIGSTYMEIDIDNQKFYGFVDGKLVLESNIVTGFVGKADTPRGVFYMWAKEEDAVLKARSRVSGLDYETPVEYWMPIDWTGIGLHDANWRSVFGGQTYINNGSNGCINLPPEFAPQVFETFEIGTPVIVH